MFFKRKGDFGRTKNGQLIMNGEWYDSEEDATDEDTRTWLIDQIILPVNSAAHVTVALIEDLIAERADVHEPMRRQQLAPESIDEDLPEEVRVIVGRNKPISAETARQHARTRREAAREGRR